MDVGIGLPATIPGVEAAQIIEWAKKVDRRGFSSLGVIDRLVYGNTEPLVTLAAAAAVTERVKLVTAILIATYRGNGALLAKQAATVDHLSGGRLVLGLAVGGREDDFEAAGESISDRGRRFDRQLEEMHALWAGESRGYAGAVGPTPPKGRPEIVIGGASDKAFERAAKYGSGWIAGGLPPAAVAPSVTKAKAAWAAAGRTDTPYIRGLAYFALGDGAVGHAQGYLKDYYGFTGPFADQIADGALTTVDAVREAVAAYADAGLDELILFPANPDPSQVDLLADALGLVRPPPSPPRADLPGG